MCMKETQNQQPENQNHSHFKAALIISFYINNLIMWLLVLEQAWAIIQLQFFLF